VAFNELDVQVALRHYWLNWIDDIRVASAGTQPPPVYNHSAVSLATFTPCTQDARCEHLTTLLEMLVVYWSPAVAAGED